ARLREDPLSQRLRARLSRRDGDARGARAQRPPPAFSRRAQHRRDRSDARRAPIDGRALDRGVAREALRRDAPRPPRTSQLDRRRDGQPPRGRAESARAEPPRTPDARRVTRLLLFRRETRRSRGCREEKSIDQNGSLNTSSGERPDAAPEGWGAGGGF